jgi:hypothetical protein
MQEQPGATGLDWKTCIIIRKIPQIFPAGLENLRELKNYNVWKPQQSAKAVEVFLFPKSRTGIESSTERFPYKDLRWILKNNKNSDYIITEQLDLKTKEAPHHPLVQVSQDVEAAIDKVKNEGSFHLGNVLRFLTKSPYGLYANFAHMALMGFVLGRYVGKLYETGTGRLITDKMMQDKILSLFKYWQDDKEGEKLQVRYGTMEEKVLTDKLKSIFGLKELEGLTNVRWGIRDWVKQKGYPLLRSF